jgi:antitoxin component of MazEF toxin-antitoxin module
MKTIRRLVRNGNSTQVTIEQRFLEFLRWRQGDYVVVELTERNTLEVRPAMGSDLRATAPTAAPEPRVLESTR